MAATATTGADQCKLVEESQERKYDCPVCLQVLRDPCISLCCRNDFCRTCVLKLRKAGNPCPLCRNSNFRTRRNIHLSLKVCHLQVYCPNKSKGCGWVGDFGEYEVHLNQRPAMRYQFQGCHFIDVSCQYCSHSFQRGQLRDHYSICPRRPFRCGYCQSYNSFYEDVSRNHWPVCDYYPLQCPNNCSEQIPRQCLQSHITNDCSMTIIECEFKTFGCTAKLSRGEMEIHMETSIAMHDSLKMMTKLMSQLKMKHKEMCQHETKLHEKIKSLIKEQKGSFEKRISITTNEITSKGQQQMERITELNADFTKQSEKLFKEQRKTLEKQVIGATDHIEERLWQMVEERLSSICAEQVKHLKLELKKQSDELKTIQKRVNYTQRPLRHHDDEKELDRNAKACIAVFFLLIFWLGLDVAFKVMLAFLLVSCICFCILS